VHTVNHIFASGVRASTILVLSIGFITGARVEAEDLREIYNVSLERDSRFIAARFKFESVSENVKLARARLLPSLFASYDYEDNTQDIKRSDNQVFQQGKDDFDTKSYGVELSQPLFRFGDWVALRQAKAEVAQSLLEFTAAEQDLILRVSEAYLGVLAAKDNVNFATAELIAVKRQLDLVTARRDSGLATRTDFYDAQARYTLSVANEIAAKNKLEDSYRALSESTGRLDTDLAVLKDKIALQAPQPQDIDQWVQAAGEQNLELQAKIRGVEIAQQERRRLRANHYPTLDLAANFDNRDTSGSLFGGGSEVERTDIALRFRLPIYQGGSVSASVRQAGKDLGRAREESTLQARIVDREVRAAYLGVISGIQRVEALRDSVVAQDAALTAKQKGNLAGINTTLNVLDAERDLYFIKRDFAQARYDYLLSTLRLKRATGTLSQADLDGVNAMLNEEQ